MSCSIERVVAKTKNSFLSKVTKADHIDPSAAISARSYQSFACRKFDTKAMVIIRSSRKPGSQDEEMPDWSDARQEDE